MIARKKPTTRSVLLILSVMLVVLTALLLVSFSPADQNDTVSADELTFTGTTWADLDSFIGTANPGDTVVITGDITAAAGDPAIYIDKQLTIRGATGNEKLIYAQPDRHFSLSTGADLTLTNIILQGNDTGGGIYVADAVLTVGGGAVIQNCFSANNGGGIRGVNDSYIYVDGGQIINNAATGNGGGICHSGTTGVVNVYGDSKISYNSAGNAGGGIYCDTTGSIIRKAGTIADGPRSTGRINVYGDAEISYNEAVYQGGGIYFGGQASVTVFGNAVIMENSSFLGGGILNDSRGGSVKVYGDAVISNNDAAGNGGGIQNNSGTVEVYDNAKIFQNTAADGAGIYNNSTGRIDIYGDAAVAENIATNGAGIFNNSTGNIVVSDRAVLSNNDATGNGGGLFNNSAGQFDILGDAAVTGNTAVDGAGIYNNSTGNIVVSDNVVISNNTAAGNGGGIYAADYGSLYVYDVSFIDNSAAKMGKRTSDANALIYAANIHATIWTLAHPNAPQNAQGYNNYDINNIFLSVTYDGNGSDDDSDAPFDPNAYSSGNTATVLDQGALVKTGYLFEGWARTATATAAEFSYDSTLNTISPSSFTIFDNAVLYAVWVQDPSYVPDNVLTLRVSGPGSIELDYGGNTFAVTTTAQYSISPGTPVTVTAVLNSSEFVRWTINSSAAPNPFSTSADTNAFNMAGDYDLTAVFKINSLPPSDGTYYITATSDAGSTISPSGVVAVPKGADKTFTFSAKNGYYVSAVIVDGKSLSIGQIDAGSYTFMDVNMNHTIEVRSIAGTRGDLILKIEVMTGEGYAEYSINGSLYTKYTGVVGLPDFADIGVKAYAGEGFEFEKWVTPAVLTTPEIFFEDNGASLNLELYFSDSGSGAGSDDGWIWWVVALILVLLLAGTFLWLFFFYRRYYDVIKTDVKIEGADRVHRKSEYRFKAEGATGTAFYRIGEDDDAVWKQILPGPDGEYAIPRGEITDKVTIEFR